MAVAMPRPSGELAPKLPISRRDFRRSRRTPVTPGWVVDATGIEPVTPSMSTRCSPAELRVRMNAAIAIRDNACKASPVRWIADGGVAVGRINRRGALDAWCS